MPRLIHPPTFSVDSLADSALGGPLLAKIGRTSQGWRLAESSLKLTNYGQGRLRSGCSLSTMSSSRQHSGREQPYTAAGSRIVT